MIDMKSWKGRGRYECTYSAYKMYSRRDRSSDPNLRQSFGTEYNITKNANTTKFATIAHKYIKFEMT
jgi:hypothetical protein